MVLREGGRLWEQVNGTLRRFNVLLFVYTWFRKRGRGVNLAVQPCIDIDFMCICEDTSVLLFVVCFGCPDCTDCQKYIFCHLSVASRPGCGECGRGGV